jgi:hypothetical protein
MDGSIPSDLGSKCELVGFHRWWIRQRRPNADLKAAIPSTDFHRRAMAIIHRRGTPTLRETTAANRPITLITARRRAGANRPAPISTTSTDPISRGRLVVTRRPSSSNSSSNNIISRLIPNTVAAEATVAVVTVHHHRASLSCHRKSIGVANRQTDNWHAPPRSGCLALERATSMVWISIRIPRRRQDRLQDSRARALPTEDLINLTTTWAPCEAVPWIERELPKR